MINFKEFMPDPAAIRRAVGKLERVQKEYRCTVDMDLGEVKRAACGTIACHGGFYAIGHYLESDIPFTWSQSIQEYEYAYKENRTLFLTYGDGRDLLAEDLGLTFGWQLEEWARENPDVWGNEFGSSMFCAKQAFGVFDAKQVTLQDIINHWLDVAGRIEERNAK